MNASCITFNSWHITLWSLYCQQMVLLGTHCVYYYVKLDNLLRIQHSPRVCVSVFTDLNSELKNVGGKHQNQ